jgi:nucleotide-binding universal stress UspA family protein
MKVLVPTDFSTTSTSGLNYAVSFVKNYGGGEIIALNVIEEEPQREEAMKKLAAFCNVAHPNSIKISHAVTLGDAYDRVGAFATENGCELVVMASHGARGIQKLTGSRVLKMVSRTNLPFVVTQREVYDDEVLDKIAIPITLETEDKKILSTVAAIAAPLHAEVVLIYQDSTDEFISATIARNLNFAKSFLRRHGIQTQSVDVGHKLSFDEGIVKYAAAHQCDLIATVNHHNDGFLNLFGAGFDQNLLENSAHIPILTVDVRNHETVNDIFKTTM